MNLIKETGAHFFDACETGKGWDVCSQHGHPDASFSAQPDMFAGIDTRASYTEAMKVLIACPVPDACCELKAFAVYEKRDQVMGFAVFRGTHTGDGGPVPASDKAVETDYVYVIEFDRDRIRHMTKTWNDGYAMRQLGWGA